jgi:aminoglycoside phosphotransferase
MKHPDKWRETEDPFELTFHTFKLTEVLGYPHAGNDVFQVRGIHCDNEVDAFIKVARQKGADLENEINTIRMLNCDLTPQIIDFDSGNYHFLVTLAKTGERLSTIVGDNTAHISLEYMYEYGQTLAQLHGNKAVLPHVKDRRFFHIPERANFEKEHLEFVCDYLMQNQPKEEHLCFCHGDFHYANILWNDHHISGILDFELSGTGIKEFDIAWALILRPGQKFLDTPEEIERFKEGYFSTGEADWESVLYYMILIYSYFYSFAGITPEYRAYIRGVFQEYCINK